FSSRRRHTISKRDWSSDVCSSDLTMRMNSFVPDGPLLQEIGGEMFSPSCVYFTGIISSEPNAGLFTLIDQRPPLRLLLDASFDRSDERRVGKECSARWSSSDAK